MKAETARPSARATINSYRSFGYNLSTAVADILDNSISAGATEISISYKWKGKESYISILDNGNGMSSQELVRAMTPGSKDPEHERVPNDLGRFGMGLKTASFSQCKQLTCVTKKDNLITKRCWDIDFINQEDEWILLDRITDPDFLIPFEKLNSGTLILWEKLDRIVGEAEMTNEYVKDAFYAEMRIVRDHLGMVFHRFIESKKIKFLFQNELVPPINPFLLQLSTKPEMGIPEQINRAMVTYFILPHMSLISRTEYDMSGGPLGWHHNQGFYIYRADRLLVAGDWLGLQKKREYAKLARIAIDIPNSEDFDWNLDIKKSTATPPIHIRKDLQRVASIAIKKSAKIYNWRGQKSFDGSFDEHIETLWTDEKNREGVMKYRINRKHPAVKAILDTGNKMIVKALKLLEDNVPIQLILQNQNEDPSFHELEKQYETPSDELIGLAVELYTIYSAQGIPEPLARQQIMSSTPFNLFPLINDYLK
ncbi:MAG: ATP-binding protein [Sphingobacterium sp.]